MINEFDDLDDRGILSEGVIDGQTAMESIIMPGGNPSFIFFRPDKEFLKWIADYAGDRLIIDVGCGSGHIISKLSEIGSRVMGIEPFMELNEMMNFNATRIKAGKSMIQLLPRTIQECGAIVKTLGKGGKALLMFARPCHSHFVEEAIDLMPEGMEALYITVPQNLKRYDDLGKWRTYFKKVKHKGMSADKEVVYSITK